MSSKNTKKNVAVMKTTNSIVTRNKSAQQSRQLRAKNKKIEKPVITKPSNKPETNSTKEPNTNATCRKDTPLKTKMRQLAQLVEQVEYYPDKLKRDVCIKKVLLKPKHNFKVIASTNKRKLAVPQKGGQKSPPPLKRYRRNSSKSVKSIKNGNNKNHTELSMVDMVKLIEDHHSLSDEDFMEILTCPSPVWWEDPPDDEYIEDAICTRTPDSSSPASLNLEKNNKTEDISRTNTPTKDLYSSLTDFENEIEQFKISPTKIQQSEKFDKKKQKLESILGNIKSVKSTDATNNTKNKNEVKNDTVLKVKEKDQSNNIENDKDVNNKRLRRISNSTDGEDLSDISFNEEEVLKNLENIDIPIEETDEQTAKSTDGKTEIDIQGIETVKNEIKNVKINELVVPDKLPPLTRKPNLNINILMKSELSDSNTEYNIDNECHSVFRFISDDDISIDESTSNNSNKKMKIVNISSSLGESSSIIDVDTIDTKEYEIKKEQSEINTSSSDKSNDFLPKKVVNDLSEYITVYKIMSNDNEKPETKIEPKSQSSDNSANNNNLHNVRGKLNSFFKKCKSNKLLKKSDPFPATSVTDVKEKVEKENSDDQAGVENDKNRLKPCDYCVVKSGNGTKKFSCEKCEKAPIFACNLCNFLADTKEIYKKHVSSCKDVARISWNHSYLMNQT